VNIKDVISSGLLESYVLGTATAEEAALVQRLCKQHPELLREIEAIENGLIGFSEQLAPPLDPALKNKVASQLSFKRKEDQEAKTLPLNSNRTLGLYKFGMAASLLLFVSSAFYTWMLHRKVTRLSGELAEMTAERSYMAQEMQVQQASMTATREQLQIASDPKVKKVALNGMNSMVAMNAAVLWNTETKEVYFNARTMPLPGNKQYQLWAIVNGKPVDAGVIELDSNGVFQKMKVIPEAQAFAVTIENKGGSPTPSLETMCLLGNV
jgi:anti-sigma-K factor RskA